MSEGIAGSAVIAKALKAQGVKYAFGVVGIPVIEIAEALSVEGIAYYGMRNEQAASYAASAIGYLSGVPAVCLCVSGPGMVHALAGMSNAQVNCWPLIVLAGSSERAQENMGAFQEFPQVDAARMYCKFTVRPPSIAQIPLVVEKAVRLATYGRPGVCYIDIPADFVNAEVNPDTIPVFEKCAAPPACLADPAQIERATQLLSTAKTPLVIIGKGAQFSRAESEVKELIEFFNIPFLPTPMAKGLLPDDHDQCVAAARSTALKTADVVILLGARLNWILHFGKPPRFRADVKIIQVDIAPEEFGNNVSPSRSVNLFGHLPLVVRQLYQGLKTVYNGAESPRARYKEWWRLLLAKREKNKRINSALMQEEDLPMSYYRAFAEIKKGLPRDVFLVSEGANTMDIGRTILDQYLPRSRLDAATFGTMGVGLGNAIAAQVLNPDRMIVCIEGDSAWGFSGMELETACRHLLPILFIIINNNGIYTGMDSEAFKSWDGALPSTLLLPNARYEMMAVAFGGHGVYCEKPEQLYAAVQDFVSKRKEGKALTTVVNVAISPYGARKAQEFGWLTSSEDQSKL
ncbi:MAG: hypothetical protein SGCHY_005177 [Lobulomycetales sp.]